MLDTQPPHEESFAVKNVSDKAVRILSVHSSCSCTVGKCSVRELQPGESGFIIVRFDPKGKRGRQVNTVEVYTDADPDPYVLTLSMEVVESLDVNPRVLIWTADCSANSEKSVRLHLNGAGKVLSASIEGTSEGFISNLRRVNEDTWEMAVRPGGGARSNLTSQLTVIFETEKTGRLTSNVHLLLRP